MTWILLSKLDGDLAKTKIEQETCDTGFDEKVPLGVAKGYSVNLSRTANVRTYSKEIVSKASFNALFIFLA